MNPAHTNRKEDFKGRGERIIQNGGLEGKYTRINMKVYLENMCKMKKLS